MIVGMVILLDATLKTKYMNDSYTRVSQIIQDLKNIKNEDYTTEELAQYLIEKLDKTLRNQFDLISLFDLPVKLNY